MASNWRNTRAYRIWRSQVIRRDKRCVICSTIEKRHAHHLNHATYFPELRFDADNGVCLCATCHSLYHNKFHGSTRKKCDHKAFIRFMKLINGMRDYLCATN